MEFRADVNGLRAIAILSVVLFHYGVPWLSGGFVGVDIFFVISGYLLTSIAVNGIRKGTYRWQEFLLHRARRIIPALVAMLLGSLALGFINYLPVDYDGLAKAARSSILFISNISFYDNLGYFSPDAKTNMLLHTWTLSVEWQFYLLFAFLCLFFWPNTGRIRKTAGNAVFWLIAVTSLADAVVQTTSNQPAAFYLLPARTWEFMVGSIVAIHGDAIRARLSPKLLGIFGMALIAWSIFTFAPSDAFPGWRALGPVLGSASIIAARQGKINDWLGLAPLQFIGNISYSLYLWHWPILVWARNTFGTVSPLQSLALIVIAIALSIVSWRYIEKPTRRSTGGFRISASYGGAILAAIVWSLLVHKEHGFPARLPSYLIEAAEANTLKNPHRDACFNDPTSMTHPDGCVVGAGDAAPTIALWGDSHADQLQNVIEQLLTNERLLVVTYGGCPPFIGPALAGTGTDFSLNCASFANRSFQRIIDSPSIKVVVLAADWRRYSTDFMLRTLHQVIGDLTKSGKKVVVIGAIPDPKQDVPKALGREELRQRRKIETVTIPLPEESEVHNQSLQILDGISQNAGVTAIDPFNSFCPDSKCYIVANGKPLYLDTDHLNLTGAQWLKADLRNALEGGKEGSVHPQSAPP